MRRPYTSLFKTTAPASLPSPLPEGEGTEGAGSNPLPTS